MSMAIWILFCLFCAVGMVQCGFWLAEAARFPDLSRSGFCVVPLYDEPDQLEDQVRTALASCARRRSTLPVILVDMGLGEECRHICERLSCDLGAFYICEEHELLSVMRQLDGGYGPQDLQKT